MKTKQTAPGSPAYDWDEITDPFAPRGEHLHDRPDLAAVNADVYDMDHRFDDLHIDAGMGPTPIPSPENAAQHDARGELEHQMRERYIGGPTNGDPLQHGHTLPVTYEQAIRYSPGSVREPLMAAQAEQERFQSAMWSEFQNRYPELAADPAATAAAVDYAMAQLKWHDQNPDTWIRANAEQFISDVALYQRGGYGERQDSGRTGGITSGASVPQRDRPEDKMDDTQFHIEMQRRKGIYG
jgi:hypothetical protein